MGTKEQKAHLDKIRKMPLKKMPKWLKTMVDEKNRLIESGEVHNLHVYLSQPNSKGAPHSVSTIPVADCPNCSACSKQCYDLRHDCRNLSVCMTRARNSAILEVDPERFFEEINAYCKTLDKFRYNVGGDVKDVDYFDHVVQIARNNPHCKFHIFTKNYDAVNEWISSEVSNPLCENWKERDCMPSNINLRFSTWPGLDMYNPYGINTAEVVFEDEFVVTKPYSAICSGNCTQCAIHNKDCFDKHIKTIYLPVH